MRSLGGDSGNSSCFAFTTLNNTIIYDLLYQPIVVSYYFMKIAVCKQAIVYSSMQLINSLQQYASRKQLYQYASRQQFMVVCKQATVYSSRQVGNSLQYQTSSPQFIIVGKQTIVYISICKQAMIYCRRQVGNSLQWQASRQQCMVCKQAIVYSRRHIHNLIQQNIHN